LQDDQPDEVLKQTRPRLDLDWNENLEADYPPYVASLMRHLRTKLSYASPEDVTLARKAFFVAYELHKHQTRKSGEPYIIHPYEVALILTELNAGGETIAAGFLHDILEDTDFTNEEMTEAFGETVCHLVDGVTKLSKFSFSSKEERQAENFRRMFVAMAKDIRVVILKLADRLHNMRTLDHMTDDKQKKIAQETLDIFAPLAHRLGIGRLKWELEDLCLRYLHPSEYLKISQELSQKRAVREETLGDAVDVLKKGLIELGHNFYVGEEDPEKARQKGKQIQILSRVKNFYSIYNKIYGKNKQFTEIYDYYGLRVLAPTETDCYTVLGIVHAIWKPIPGRFKDYIAMPKQNMYQSLHTTVMGRGGQPLEVQIRTHEMEQISEYGIAAHWKYKQGGKASKTDLQLTWLRQLLDWQNDLKDAEEFMDNIKDNLFEDDVYVFTPQGDLHVLPRGATAVDFAYKIHTQVGNRCIGAKMNGRIISLPTPLKNGAQVEILTSKNSQPNLGWLNFVITNQAKNQIRKHYKKEQRDDNIKRGRELLETEFGKEGLENFLKSKNMEELAQRFNRNSVDDLLATVGYGEITPRQLVNRVRTGPLNPDKLPKAAEKILGETVPVGRLRRGDKQREKGLLIAGEAGVMAFFPKCCTPVPGEPIIGVVTRGKGVAVHSKECLNLSQVNEKRYIPASWGVMDNQSYPVELEIFTIDRRGLLKDVITRLSDNKINILAANINTNQDKTAKLDLVVEVSNIDELHKIMQKLRQMSDVLSVNRVVKMSRNMKKATKK
jgi:GTP diphosphokinase / guanosine-3',5'-bis(diphosphate) 3'-diphosphatase